MRTKKFETRLMINSNIENYDIEFKKYLKTLCRAYNNASMAFQERGKNWVQS